MPENCVSSRSRIWFRERCASASVSGRIRHAVPSRMRRIFSSRAWDVALLTVIGRLVVALRPLSSSGRYCCGDDADLGVVRVQVALAVPEPLRAG